MVVSSYRVSRLAAELSKCVSPESRLKFLEDNLVTLAELEFVRRSGVIPALIFE